MLSIGDTVGTQGIDLLSGDGQVVLASGTRLRRLDGRRATILALLPRRARLVAVDATRILVRRPGDGLELLDRNGRLRGRIAPHGRFVAAAFDGGRMLVQTAARLDLYNSRDGRPLRGQTLHRDAASPPLLLGSRAGIAVFRRGRRLWLIRLTDGHAVRASLADHPALQEAQLAGDGLYLLAGRTLAFVPTTRLLDALR